MQIKLKLNMIYHVYGISLEIYEKRETMQKYLISKSFAISFTHSQNLIEIPKDSSISLRYEFNCNFQTGDTTLVDAAFRVPGKSFIMDDADDAKTVQELRMLSSSLFDCQSLTLNIKIRVSQFVGNSPLGPVSIREAIIN